MRRQLNHFQVDGSYGWNQDWFPDFFMRMGGCAAVTACDACVYFALRMGRRALVPFPVPVNFPPDTPVNQTRITRAEYLTLSRRVKPFLHPRMRGIDRLEIYQDGFQRYLTLVGEREPVIRCLHGEVSVQEAETCLTEQIDRGIPIPFLTLRHKDPAFDFYEWHWYLLMGYETRGGRLYAQAVTYGSPRMLDFQRLWDTGFTEKGGMILFSFPGTQT